MNALHFLYLFLHQYVKIPIQHSLKIKYIVSNLINKLLRVSFCTLMRFFVCNLNSIFEYYNKILLAYLIDVEKDKLNNVLYSLVEKEPISSNYMLLCHIWFFIVIWFCYDTRLCRRLFKCDKKDAVSFSKMW